MRRDFTTALMLLGLCAFVGVESARGQMVYTGGAPTRPGGRAFQDEPVMSINNSYLGYGDFTYYGPPVSPFGNARRPAAPTRGYVVAPAPPLVRRRVFWYRGRRYYQN